MRLFNFKGEQKTITEALRINLPEHAVISLTGAGGKTSMMLALGRELAAAGKRVVLTTTTHVAHPDQFTDDPDSPYAGISVICSDADPREICRQADAVLRDLGIVMVLSPDATKLTKATAPPESVLEHLYKTADAVIIEADGSRCMPFKIPCSWEPVVPERTDFTICLAGLTALGMPVEDAMFRSELLPEALHREFVDESLMSTVIASYEGGQKGIHGDFRVFLNQADNEGLRNAASRIQKILGLYGIQSAWGSLRE